jgi:hypothetical protein
MTGGPDRVRIGAPRVARGGTDTKCGARELLGACVEEGRSMVRYGPKIAPFVAAAVLCVAGAVAAADDAPTAPPANPAPGEPAIREPHRRPLPEAYEHTKGAHAERPGKHSTTAGRHGTVGETGGGTNTQSGSEAAHTHDPVLRKRQHEERNAD